MESTQHVFKTSGDVYVTKCKLSRNALGMGKRDTAKTKANDHNDKKSAGANKASTNVVVVTGNQPRAVFRR